MIDLNSKDFENIPDCKNV